MPDRLWEWLEDVAAKEGVSVSHLIRDILIVWQNDKKPRQK